MFNPTIKKIFAEVIIFKFEVPSIVQRNEGASLQ